MYLITRVTKSKTSKNTPVCLYHIDLLNQCTFENGTAEYFLKWKEYLEENNTWEPEDNQYFLELFSGYKKDREKQKKNRKEEVKANEIEMDNEKNDTEGKKGKDFAANIRTSCIISVRIHPIVLASQKLLSVTLFEYINHSVIRPNNSKLKNHISISKRSSEYRNEMFRFQIFVIGVSGKTLVLDATHHTSVKDLKQEILQKIGMPRELQNLMHTTNKLNDEKDLKYYNIKPYAVLTLYIKLSGGNRRKMEESRGKKKKAKILRRMTEYGDSYDSSDYENYYNYDESTLFLERNATIKNRYLINEVIGRGGFGVVYDVTDTKSKQKLALKVVDIRSDVNRNEITRNREIRNLTGCKHILATLKIFSYNINYTCLVLPNMDTDLFKLIDRNSPMGLRTIQNITYQTARGLRFLHDHGYIHRDLKPQNILLKTGARGRIFTENGKLNWENVLLSISDYGCMVKEKRKGSLVGTLATMPPEAIMNNKYGQNFDSYSLGCILTFAYGGVFVFEAKDNATRLLKLQSFRKNLTKMIELKDCRETYSISELCSNKNLTFTKFGNNTLLLNLYELVLSLLQHDEFARPNMKQVLDHDFIKNK